MTRPQLTTYNFEGPHTAAANFPTKALLPSKQSPSSTHKSKRSSIHTTSTQPSICSRDQRMQRAHRPPMSHLHSEGSLAVPMRLQTSRIGQRSARSIVREYVSEEWEADRKCNRKRQHSGGNNCSCTSRIRKLEDCHLGPRLQTEAAYGESTGQSVNEGRNPLKNICEDYPNGGL